MKELIPLSWKKRRRNKAWPLESIEYELVDNEALLADHSYEVWRDGSLEYRGLVQETDQAYRRAQGYDSLKDLLNDLINDIDPRGSSKPRLRKVLQHDDVPDDEQAPPAMIADGGGLSYFRLFHAFEQFRKRLREVGSMSELEKLLFVYPGSLQELVSKVNEQAAVPGGSTVFNWFLLQEADSLHAVALGAYARHRAKYTRTTPSDRRKWASLKPKTRAVSLPAEIGNNAEYMQRLLEACGYGQ